MSPHQKMISHFIQKVRQVKITKKIYITIQNIRQANYDHIHIFFIFFSTYDHIHIFGEMAIFWAIRYLIDEPRESLL